MQMHSAMCTLGLTFEDLKTMEEPKQIFDFVKATFAATIQVCALLSDDWTSEVLLLLMHI